MYRWTIPDTTWSRLEPVLLKNGMRATKNLRLRIEAIRWRLRTGSPWRDQPRELGPWSSNFNFFNFWSKAAAWQRVFELLRGEPDNEWNFIDSSLSKAHRHAHGARGKNPASQGIGKSRGGWTSKIHTRCDALGNPIEFVLTPGNINDISAANQLTENCQADNLIADKGYDSQLFRDNAFERGIVPHIPRRQKKKTTNVGFDEELYKARHCIENFFCKLKDYRAIATRFDKLGRNFLSSIYLAATIISLN